MNEMPNNMTHNVIVEDCGRIVLPAEVCQRSGLAEGIPMLLVESPDGLVLLTRQQMRERVRADLAGLDLVGDLLNDRRRAAADEDAA